MKPSSLNDILLVDHDWCDVSHELLIAAYDMQHSSSYISIGSYISTDVQSPLNTIT